MISSEEREEIERDIKRLLDAGVDVRIEGRGVFIVDAKNLPLVEGFKEKADSVRKLVRK